jgi:hypothetical protein
MAAGVIPISTSILFLDGVSSSTIDRVATLTINDLVAVSDYDAYCLTVSNGGVVMKYPDMLASKTRLTTSCCKIISIALMTKSLIQREIEQNMVVVTFDSAPLIRVELSLFLIPVDGSVYTPINPFVPKSLVLLSTAMDLSYNLGFNGAPANSYLLTANLSSSIGSVSEYSIIYTRGVMLRVDSVQTEPDPPVLIRAKFSSEGTSVAVGFDSATNKAGFSKIFPCANLLFFRGSSSAQCLWTDSSTISIYPSGNILPVVGDTVNVLGDMLKAQCTVSNCSSWRFVSSLIAVNITAPDDPSTPSVLISSATLLSSCDSLLLDITSSGGSAGRPWKDFFITVKSPTANVSSLQSFL